MRVTTWNVLHHIHAVNWNEAPVTAFPDERLRIDAIAKTVAHWFTRNVDVICLQEASGDQLARLREAVGPDVHVFDHIYPRVPRLRDGGATDLEDASEHLVVLVKALPARVRAAATFGSDRGKGLLAIDVGDDVIVVDTHVSWGERCTAQLAFLAQATQDDRRKAVVVGDFNASAEVVQAGLGEDFVLASVTEPTRIATATSPAKTIDHVAVRGARITSVEVLDPKGLSDHHPVTAEIR